MTITFNSCTLNYTLLSLTYWKYSFLSAIFSNDLSLYNNSKWNKQIQNFNKTLTGLSRINFRFSAIFVYLQNAILKIFCWWVFDRKLWADDEHWHYDCDALFFIWGDWLAWVLNILKPDLQWTVHILDEIWKKYAKVLCMNHNVSKTLFCLFQLSAVLQNLLIIRWNLESVSSRKARGKKTCMNYFFFIVFYSETKILSAKTSRVVESLKNSVTTFLLRLCFFSCCVILLLWKIWRRFCSKCIHMTSLNVF